MKFCDSHHMRLEQRLVGDCFASCEQQTSKQRHLTPACKAAHACNSVMTYCSVLLIFTFNTESTRMPHALCAVCLQDMCGGTCKSIRHIMRLDQGLL
jgi:hypothetical protein